MRGGHAVTLCWQSELGIEDMPRGEDPERHPRLSADLEGQSPKTEDTSLGDEKLEPQPPILPESYLTEVFCLHSHCLGGRVK